MRAWLNLRHNIPERINAFKAGLERHGYVVMDRQAAEPKSDKDILVTWNRIGHGHTMAQNFEKRGNLVIVAENGSWGKHLAGDTWLTLARNRHNTAGRFDCGGTERFDSLGIELLPWRKPSGETVILAQRGIGSPPTALPFNWANDAQKRHGGRIRRHPGRDKSKSIPLEQDLKNCSTAVTWGSGSAVQALIWGIKVKSELPNWIGEQDNTDEGRLEMFRRMAWAQWRLPEIAKGEPFECLFPW